VLRLVSLSDEVTSVHSRRIEFDIGLLLEGLYTPSSSLMSKSKVQSFIAFIRCSCEVMLLLFLAHSIPLLIAAPVVNIVSTSVQKERGGISPYLLTVT
jgi:hypothetical protein